MRRPCGTRPTPRRAIAYDGSRSIDSPAKRIVPRRGGVKPMIERISVVLPTPLRPSTAVTAPAGARSVTPCRMWLCS